MDEKKPITLEDLAQTLGDFTQEMRTGFKAAHEYSRQGFETLSAKIDMIDENKPDKGEFETKSEKMIEMINERTFSPDEKTSILDTVKLANDHLGDNVTGKGNITLRTCSKSHRPKILKIRMFWGLSAETSEFPPKIVNLSSMYPDTTPQALRFSSGNSNVSPRHEILNRFLLAKSMTRLRKKSVCRTNLSEAD